MSNVHMYTLMNNAVYGKTMENLRNRIDIRLVSNKKRLSKMDIKTKLSVTKISGNDLVPLLKSKITLMLNKPAYIGMCMLDLSKVLNY